MKLVGFLSCLIFGAVACAGAENIGESNLDKLIAAGDAQISTDKLAQASETFKSAVTLFPKSSEAHQRLGHALSLRGSYEPALEEERKALKLDQSNSEAHCNMGWIFGIQQEYRAAIDESRLAIAANAKNSSAYSILGLSLASLGNYSLAVPAFEKAVELDPSDANSLLNLAAALGREGKYAAAIKTYRRALQSDPSSPVAYVGLGAALGKLGDLKGQVDAYRQAVALSPDSPGNHGKLGFALSQVGDWRAAFSEGVIANGLRLRSSSTKFLRILLTAWAAIFLVFGLFFAVIYAGSKFKTQPGESVVKSFFLTFYKDKPGRFIITTRRLVFVPEAFSHWFGATRLMIELDQVDKIESQSTLAGGKLSLSTLNGSVYHFSMPNLVLEPLTQKLKEIAAQHSNHEVHSVSLDNALTPTPSDTDPFIEEIITAQSDSNVVGDGTNMNSTIEVTMSPNMVPDTKFSDPNIATDQASLIITVVPPKAGADGEAKSTSR